MLTDQHIIVIKSTIPLLESAGDALTDYFYKRMFKNNPELQHIFNMGNQKTGRQQAALFGAIAAYAKHIDNLSALSSAVEKIAHKHTSLAIKPEHYAIVGHNLIETLRELAPDAFTADVEEAWTAAYHFLADVFIDREAELYLHSRQGEGGWNGCRDFIVKDKIVESEFVTSFLFEPVDGQSVIAYKAGQYIGVEVHPIGSEYREIRQYSLSNVANAEHYRISVKRELAVASTQSAVENKPAGIVSNYLHDHVNVGDVVQLHPPAGDFFFVDHGRDVALVSAGVGITPMQAILEQLSETKFQQKVSFLHACDNASQHSFYGRTQALCRQHNWQQYSWYMNGALAKENGYLGFIDVNKAELNVDETDFYLCGPIGFMKFMKEQLLSLGVDDTRIYYEVFGAHESL